MNKHLPPILILLLLSPAAGAQQLNFTQYMQRVMQNNITYKTAQLEVQAAQQDLVAAGKYSDPVLSAGYSNNSDWGIMMGQSASVELSKTLSLGKRAARKQVAQHTLEAAQASLADYTQQLYANAADAFADALLARDLANIGREAWQHMQSLYESDSLRASSGDISPLDVLQSRLEATLALQDYRSKMAHYRNALSTLDLYMGSPVPGTLGVEGELRSPVQQYPLQLLLDSAAQWRQDLVAAHHMADAAQSEVHSVRRERMPDIDLSLGAEYSTRVRNEEAPAPEFIGYSLGLAIPLPVSTLNRGEVRASQIRAQQAEMETEYLRATIQMEVLQAFNNYETARQQVADYDSHLLEEARQVLEGKIFAYRHGETSLLEVITAQHTYNEIQQAYATALHDSMAAWIALRRSAGLPLTEL